MLSVRENFLETIKQDGKPDRLVNGYEFMNIIAPDPLLEICGHKLKPGQTGKDAFGVTWQFAEGQPAAAPLPDADVLVIKDITAWEDVLVLPDIEGHDWTSARAAADAARSEDRMVTGFMPGGLFERMHFLMGFEEALVNLMAEPEATQALLDTLGAWRLRYAEILVENMRPEMMFIHDDWGMKYSLFMSPDTWREMFKPHYEKLFGFFKDKGLIIVHHADSFLEPITGDMADMGLSVWQGVLPQNDIARLQTELGGRMTLMGGLDAAELDAASATEESVRAAVRGVCEAFGPAGHFIPCFTYGGPGDMLRKDGMAWIEDEVKRYNKDVYGV